MTDREQLARRFADLVDDDEMLRRAIAFLEGKETGSLEFHCTEGRPQVLHDRGMYRRPRKSALR